MTNEDQQKASAGETRLVRLAVELAASGDPEGVHYLYARFSPEVRRHVAYLVGGGPEVDCVTREVFAELPRRIGAYDPERRGFGTWIRQCAHDVVLGRLGAHDSDLRTAISELPAERREALILHHVAGLSQTEIATVLGTSAAA